MHPLLRFFVLAAVLLSAPFTGSAASAQGEIPVAEYAVRRDSIAGRLPADAALVAFGGRNVVDPISIFRQLPAFQYLTGFGEPDAVLVMTKQAGRATSTLFLEQVPVRTQIYDGFREEPGLVARRTGFRVRPLRELGPALDSVAAAGVPLFTLADFASSDAATRDTLTRGFRFVAGLRQRFPGVEVRDLSPLVDALRARKSPTEVALLRRAIEITVDAHREALRTLRPGMNEREMRAVVEATFLRGGGDGPSFASIVGSGPNSTTLHYVANDRTMRAGEVVVMDIGAAYRSYAADVTRTYPVSGRFSPDQRAIYQLVRDAQAAAERQARPGAAAEVSLDSSFEVRARGLARLGLIQSADASFDPPWPADCARTPRQCRQGMLWMIHGISHGIGLEVHDPAQFYTGSRTFAVGDAFTIEPGIYINARLLELLPDTPRNRAFVQQVRGMAQRFNAIGVRIEDDYLVTPTGLEWLSRAPREIREIEAAMARARPAAR